MSDIISELIDDIVEELCNGGRVSLHPLGSFKTKRKSKRTARNFQTGEEIILPEKLAVIFTPSTTLTGKLKEVL